ncbi:MAG: TIM-barrel domain-containing protein, partial [Chitinophagales bacterium]
YQYESDAQNIVSQMRAANFPLDALVLDLYWYGDPSQMGNLDWDYSRFPTPVSMMHDFDSMGIKTICIAEPYVTQSSLYYSYVTNNQLVGTDTFGNSYTIVSFWAGPAVLLDMFSSESQNWMWNYYDDRIAEGVGGWWSDLGEPEDHPYDLKHSIGMARTVHNVYSLIWAEMLYEKYQQNHPQTRLFNLTRSGYAGMQRYSTFPWSGDIQRSFDGLKAQIPIMLGMGMCGVGYMHSDIGGFTGGGQNEELYTRWQEMGSFAPIMRAHGSGVPTEPVFYSTTCQNTVRKYSDLRHQLTPYNYSLAYENSVKGTPLVRQINFYEPENSTLANINDEYLWGENLLVAPVLDQGATSRTVIFPTGKWINYLNTAQSYDGGNSATISAALDVLPLFVKAGSFIPMVPLVNSLSLYNTDTLLVNYYPDLSVSQSSYSIYDDDGKDPQALSQQNYDLISLTGTVNWHEIDVALAKSGNSFAGAPQQREMNFSLQRIVSAPDLVLMDNVSLPAKTTLNDFNAADSAFYYDASAEVLNVHFKWSGTNSLLQIMNAFLSGEAEISLNNSLLADPYPNPFNESVTIPCNKILPEKFILEIENISGQIIRKFDLSQRNPQSLTVIWDGKDDAEKKVASGIYTLILTTEKVKEQKLLVKVN